MADEQKKIAAYICKGCDIGTSIDVDALKGTVDEESTLEGCTIHDCLCSPEGVSTIKKDVDGGLSGVVIAACSPRAMTETFKMNSSTWVERVNLREFVVWSHEANHEDTQMMAEDYLRMGIARAEKANIPEPHIEEIDRTIMVVGAGVTGLTAAVEAAAMGQKVVLVEKEEKLGGWVNRFKKGFPNRPPYKSLIPGGCDDLVKAAEENEEITIYTGASLEKIEGAPGLFDVTLKTGGKTEEFRVGAIVQATGWRPYDATKLMHLGYGNGPNVVTNVQMEEILASGSIVRPSDSKPPKKIAFIQCAGSRDKDHLPYCSSVCCRVSLKQAVALREALPDSEIYIIYKDIRTPGQYEDFYKEVQEDPGILMTKGEVVKVEATTGDGYVIEVDDTLIEPKIEIDAEMIVLATGMVPNAADGEILRILADSRSCLAEENPEKPRVEAAEKAIEEYSHKEGTNILNLDYRQGPDLPALKYDFPDSHYICFPYETRRTGVYAAGCMRAPNDSDSCIEDARGATLKAIQCLELTSQGKAVHPRWGDQSWPDFFLQRCTQCKRCTEECPFGTLNEDVKGTPLPNPTRCRRCGICMGACPERIISFADTSIDSISSMVKAINVPDEYDEKPRLLGFLCENDAYPALDMAGMAKLTHSAWIRFIPVRCLGAVNVIWINDAFSSGFDGVLLVGCPSGDDYQCHYMKGSELMGTRGKNVKEKLITMALEEERVRLEELSITDWEKLPKIIDEFAEEIEGIGMNPFKGF